MAEISACYSRYFPQIEIIVLNHFIHIERKKEREKTHCVSACCYSDGWLRCCWRDSFLRGKVFLLLLFFLYWSHYKVFWEAWANRSYNRSYPRPFSRNRRAKSKKKALLGRRRWLIASEKPEIMWRLALGGVTCGPFWRINSSNESSVVCRWDKDVTGGCLRWSFLPADLWPSARCSPCWVRADLQSGSPGWSSAVIQGQIEQINLSGGFFPARRCRDEDTQLKLGQCQLQGGFCASM